MKTVIGSSIRVTNPTNELMKWATDHLVIPNPEYIKKTRMHFWTGNTPKLLYMYEMHGDELILPFGVLRSVLPMLTKDALTVEFVTRSKVDYQADVPLYDYQETAVEAAYENQYGIIQSAAGSGKTQMGIALVAKFGRRALWLTHTADLLSQSRERAARYMDKSMIGTITEGKVNIGSGITFATVQTMCKLDLAQYRDMWDVIIVDECHRVAGTPTVMTQFYKVLNSLCARHKYGLSATVHRSDGMITATYAILGEVIHTVPDEAVKDKIMRVGICAVGTGTTISQECINTDGTLNYTKLITYLTGDFERNMTIRDCIAQEWQHPCLILSDRLEHLETLMVMLPKSMQEFAVMISGKMTSKKGKAEREKALDDMRKGYKKYLFATYSLAKEGLDVPCLERLFLVTPQKDYAVITQSIGRIARIAEGKQPPIAYDFVDDIPYLRKSYKTRCTTYRKNGCYFTEDTQ